MSTAEGPVQFARTLASVVKEMTRRSPAPRSFPFFGLDLPDGCAGRALSRLSDRGFFRYYEQVLDLSDGVGGAARWLVREVRCRVVSVSADHARARASANLSIRSGAEGVRHLAARPSAIPVADEAVTRVWGVLGSALPDLRLDELWRVLRPAGIVALQVVDSAERIQAFGDALVDRGFFDVEIEDVEGLLEERTAVASLAAEKMGLEPSVVCPPGSVCAQVVARRPG